MVFKISQIWHKQHKLVSEIVATSALVETRAHTKIWPTRLIMRDTVLKALN